MSQLLRITENLHIHRGNINVGIVLDRGRALLIDYGSGDVAESLRALGVRSVDWVLATHHHRDQVSGLLDLRPPPRIAAPQGEAALFAEVERFWNDPARRWHLYSERPHPLALARSLPVERVLAEGDTATWGDTRVTVLDTPGHTDGSLSFIVEEGDPDWPKARVIFTGDCLYGWGKTWDVYSLQKGITSRDYHGFMGDRPRLEESLLKIADAGAEMAVPSHGEPFVDPSWPVQALIDNLDHCYAKAAACSSLRFYMPGVLGAFADGRGHVPFGEQHPVPSFLRRYGTSWVVLSETGAALVMDCGGPRVLDEVQAMIDRGEIRRVEVLWISHAHDDHTDAAGRFAQRFGCPVYADRRVAEIIENPLAWRMPCNSPEPVRVDCPLDDGEAWRWHEFLLTAFHFPGQSLYHGGLLVEGRGQRLFFTGDSFTPGGLDDYCPGNRNFLGEGRGYQRCLDLLLRLGPALLFNSHVQQPFTLSEDLLRQMKENLREREKLFARLLPWDNPNYGLDPHWVRCHPYEQTVRAGGTVRLDVVFTNHSAAAREAVCRPVFHADWGPRVEARTASLPPGEETAVRFEFALAKDAPPGRWVVPVEVGYAGRPLGEFREAIVVIA